MFDNTRKYRVTGRYMDGKSLVGYHIVAVDDERIQSRETRDRMIYLIGRNNIINMRIQKDADGNIVLRGKGTNLNTLPVYDIAKDKYRNNEASKHAASSSVNVSKRIEYANAMGQYTLVKRIMYKNNCIGYELVDCSGQVFRKKRDTVLGLAAQRLISNATVQRYSKTGDGSEKLILRGAGCDLNSLPILIADDKGNITDPRVNSTGLSIRVASMNRSGLLKDRRLNKDIKFKAGDLLVCNADGTLSIVGRSNLNSKFKRENSEAAVCDNYLDTINNYSIEFFGKEPIEMSPNMVKSWAIMRNM